MESTEPPPATTAPSPSTPLDSAPSPATATATESEAAVTSNPPAPSLQQQQPQPSTSSSAALQAGTPKIPQPASPFPSVQQPANLSSQTQPPPQIQSHLPQPQTAAPPVGPPQQAQPLAQPQQRPPQPVRPIRPTQPSFCHLFPPNVSSPAATAAGPSSSLPSAAPSLPSSSGSVKRGGMAIGVPAAFPHQRPPQQSPGSFSTYGQSTPFGQMFSGLPRGPVGVFNQVANAGAQPFQAISSGGMVGAHTTSSMRHGGVSGTNQQRPGQLPLRTVSPSNTPTGQKFQSHGLNRGPSASSSGSTLPGSSQSSQPPQQPLLSAPGRPTNPPSLSTTSFRPQNKAQGLQQRPHQPQQQQSMPTTSQQSQTPSSQQQQKPLQHLQQQQHLKQQLQQQQQPQQTPQQQQQRPPLQPQQQQQQVAGPIQSVAKVQQSAHQQQQSSRSASQKTPAPATVQQGAIQPVSTSPTAGMDVGEPGNRIISKRSIHELVSQIDPSEKLDPEVEDILVEIAEDFVESVTTFGCSLAKHRKSTTLEAKDILLHLERNWNMTIPGFGGDEIKCYKKPFTNDIHKERLSLIKKSMVSTPDAGNAKNSAPGQSVTNAKSHATKAPLIGSPTVT